MNELIPLVIAALIIGFLSVLFFNFLDYLRIRHLRQNSCWFCGRSELAETGGLVRAGNLTDGHGWVWVCWDWTTCAGRMHSALASELQARDPLEQQPKKTERKRKLAELIRMPNPK